MYISDNSSEFAKNFNVKPLKISSPLVLRMVFINISKFIISFLISKKISVAIIYLFNFSNWHAKIMKISRKTILILKFKNIKKN